MKRCMEQRVDLHLIHLARVVSFKVHEICSTRGSAHPNLGYVVAQLGDAQGAGLHQTPTAHTHTKQAGAQSVI